MMFGFTACVNTIVPGHKKRPHSPRTRWYWIAAICLGTLGCQNNPPDPAEQTTPTPDNASNTAPNTAAQPQDVLILQAADSELARGEPRLAIELLQQIDLTTSPQAAAAARRMVDHAAAAGRPELIEPILQTMIHRAPTTASWRHSYWKWLDQQGRRQEASRQVDRLNRMGKSTTNELLSIVRRNESYPFPHSDVLPPGFDGFPPQAKARWYLARQHYDQAQQQLGNAAEIASAGGWSLDGSAAALLLRILSEQQSDSFVEIELRYRPHMTPFADYWAALGKHWIDQSQYKSAAGALLKAVEIDPTMRLAFQRLSRCFRALDRGDDADQFRYRGLQIAETETIARRIQENGRLDAAQTDLAKSLLELGRPLEMLQWTRSLIPRSATPQLAMLDQQRRQIIAMPESDSIPSTTALLGLSPDDFLLENALAELAEKSAVTGQSEPQSEPLSPTTSPKLVNVAHQYGADFQWYHDRQIQLDTIPLYESVGGGIAVLDYDLDGWPDLYFAQGGGQPLQTPTTRSSELRRNQQAFFTDVSRPAGAEDYQYSSGIAAGDVNQDGFPDLYLGAIGMNRLLINNGDGSFRDATQTLADRDPRFTSSVAIADIDGDAVPDLFDVNYIELEGAFEQPQQRADGRYELPSPLLFYAQSDRFHRAAGDGSFSSTDIDSDVIQPASGLGIIVSEIDGQRGNEILVGNDLRENHYLRFQNGHFTDAAHISGVASGSHGLANGCMGIATGDFDNNGTMDLHIGNYRGESDNLFLQNPSGTFVDQAVGRGLADLSIPLVTFGSKALDFDRNGWLDIAVTNGHIFDMRFMNQGYKMSPGLMLLDGSGFRRSDVSDSSGYWDGEYLGRAMAMTDWNRDGQTDLVIGHLDAPTALLQNQTETPGRHHLMLELIGTDSERDAIGAKISLTAGDLKITQWITAGDGYFCSDESYVDIAVVGHRRVDRLEINWPSGNTSVFHDVTADARYLVLENDLELFAR
ncbi:FG-GAP-like repeat-containing protein [Stieleria sp. TO1_6]|uniref:FG-GAP-like repeat-containing protein n=1 Tax=Stieleria tagensis TaxID=2956795 RepID=UPI00209B8188|nr:FG-GAP-like repeat-containing protein [Stieleria tagensis]MCO8125020.1 FG-GAP-like repeat-containing protein [Stieleria tagensis]